MNRIDDDHFEAIVDILAEITAECDPRCSLNAAAAHLVEIIIRTPGHGNHDWHRTECLKRTLSVFTTNVKAQVEDYWKQGMN